MRNRRSRRGFSLIIVVLVLAVLAVSGMVVLDVVTQENQMLGMHRLEQEAQQVAEGGLSEIIYDQELSSILPGLSEDNLKISYSVSSDSLFSGAATESLPERSYAGSISMVRHVPVHESSLNVLRAFMYEVNVEADVNGGDAHDAAQSAVYKVFSHRAGTILPEMHAR